MPWRAAVVAAATLAALVPLPRSLVDRVYSAHVYAGLQPLITSISNLAPFALFDLLLVSVLVSWIALAIRDVLRVRGRLRAAIVITWRAVVWSAALYLAFLVVWGLNYRRVRLVDALAVDPARVNTVALKNAAGLAAVRMNALYAQAHADPLPAGDAVDISLAAALDRAAIDTGRARAVVPGRPKRTLLDWYFKRAAVDGMIDPFFLETLVATDILPFERPFIVAHEWSHLAGVADEGEANFIGWLTCLRATPAAQYSGWLFLYSELLQSLDRNDRGAVAATVGAGPRADLEAIRARIARQVNPAVSQAGWRVYDSYLKANRVQSGAASYGEVVRLVLGARLPSGWQPLSP